MAGRIPKVVLALGLCLVVTTFSLFFGRQAGEEFDATTNYQPGDKPDLELDPLLAFGPSTTVTEVANPNIDKDGKLWPSFEQIDINQSIIGGAATSTKLQHGSVRVNCGVSHFSYDDPIVTPGQPGAAHLHMFFGNTLADADSTFESLTGSGDGTCDGGHLNRSAYWIPALIDNSNNARTPHYSVVYYKSGPLHGQKIEPMPDGLVMIAGKARAKTPSENISQYEWYCGFPGGTGAMHKFGPLIPDCNPQEFVSLKLVFPQCWDGKNLDSTNHSSHMAYPVGPACPKSHPVTLPEVTYNFHWNNGDERTAGWHISSDRHGGFKVPGGTTTHGDWFGGWHPTIMQTLVEECSNKDHDCIDGNISPTQKLAKSEAPMINHVQHIYEPNQVPGKVAVDSVPKL